MKPRRTSREHGVALLALVAIIALGASYFLVKQLNAESGAMDALRKSRNAEVLSRAKLALIGYVAAQAVKPGENRPGALPCPEAAANFNDDANEGTISYPCTLPKVGRFPWRTIGLDKLVDASGEPLWYAVASGWAGASTVINSNCATYNITGLACSTGRLTVDGVTDDVVALIIAPGPAFNVAASGSNCAAKNQVRPTSGAPDWSNYLECENATYPTPDATFVTTGPSGSFNDQVIRITASELMPAIEAAIAQRIEREIVPLLQNVYADAVWGTSTSSPAFPFPAAFANPSTSSFVGQAGLTQGLLPFNYHSASCPGGEPRCSSNAISWGTPSLSTGAGTGYLPSAPSCYVSGSTPTCEGYYRNGWLTISMSDPANNITTGLRTLSSVSGHTGTVTTWVWNGSSWSAPTTQAATVSRNLASSGALNFVASRTLPWVSDWGYYSISATRVSDSVFGDLALLTSASPSTYWFVQNEWYRLLYYAIAPNHAPGGTLTCTTGSNCLQVSNMTDGTKQRAVLVLAGRQLSALSQSRPLGNGNLQDYIDSAENRNGDSVFVQSNVGSSFNDRFLSLSKNP
jgi:hypothetical protein